MQSKVPCCLKRKQGERNGEGIELTHRAFYVAASVGGRKTDNGSQAFTYYTPLLSGARGYIQHRIHFQRPGNLKWLKNLTDRAEDARKSPVINS
jgi:hypothetical protein